MDKGNVVYSAGPIEITLDYRALMEDQGVCAQVYANVDGKDTEILRFDCFDQDPHYHYGPENRNVRLHLDKVTCGTPLAWTMNNLRNNLPAMIKRAGYASVAAAVEANPVPTSLLDEIEAKGRELAISERRTVTHKFERMLDKDWYRVGNICIGLEYRLLPQINSQGLAIHVLSNIAGQEVELLAFDCFDNGPHYHYGPRNQDIRLYWDTITSGDPLAWTLNQFKIGNMRKMIERAGYPTVANDLDEALLQSMLPEIERRAWELVAENKAAQAAQTTTNDQKKTKAQLIEKIEALREQVAALES
ncbi:hypothetical protein C2W62_39245 [Candidatus Entotheonella serta]|nr:hypothetical protein C2W62_39245 [Candidatus Entotheonella serta]